MTTHKRQIRRSNRNAVLQYINSVGTVKVSDVRRRFKLTPSGAHTILYSLNRDKLIHRIKPGTYGRNQLQDKFSGAAMPKPKRAYHKRAAKNNSTPISSRITDAGLEITLTIPWVDVLKQFINER